MALQSDNPSTTPSAQVVGNAFVEQYYHILHHSPELVHKFYQEFSALSRPDEDDRMTVVTTMQGINDKICSLDYTNYKAEIETADAQYSYKDGVIVLVTGCLTGKDNLRRKFTQSFFLAPQDKGYFVLNDVFRFVDKTGPLATTNVKIDGVDDNQSASLSTVPDPSTELDPPVLAQESFQEDKVQKVEEEVQNTRDDFVVDDTLIEPEPESSENHRLVVSGKNSSVAQYDAPKMSYASILSSQMKKGSSGPTKIYVPAKASGVDPIKMENQSISIEESPAQEPPVSVASSVVYSPEGSNVQDSEGGGHSIYIRNLPLNASVSQLESEFKKFGLIKKGGVQVRSNQQQGFCFGFVEFQDSSSMHHAVMASPVRIGDRQAVVEMKRATTRVGGGRGRASLPRGGYRNDSFRGRGNFGEGRGYVRSEFRSRDEYADHGRGPGGRGGGEGFSSPRGRGRGGRRGRPIPNTFST